MPYVLLMMIGAVFAFGMGALVSFISDERLPWLYRWSALAGLAVLAVVSWYLAAGVVSTLP